MPQKLFHVDWSPAGRVMSNNLTIRRKLWWAHNEKRFGSFSVSPFLYQPVKMLYGKRVRRKAIHKRDKFRIQYLFHFIMRKWQEKYWGVIWAAQRWLCTLLILFSRAFLLFMQSIQSFRDVLSLISQNIIYFINSWSDSSTRNKEPVISVFVAEMVVKHN